MKSVDPSHGLSSCHELVIPLPNTIPNGFSDVPLPDKYEFINICSSSISCVNAYPSSYVVIVILDK